MDLNEYHKYFSKLPNQKARRRKVAKEYRKTHKYKRIDTRKEKRDILKRKAIAFLGKKCKNCGYFSNHPNIFKFHHINFDMPCEINKMINNLRKWEDIELLLLDTIIICQNCEITIY